MGTLGNSQTALFLRLGPVPCQPHLYSSFSKMAQRLATRVTRRRRAWESDAPLYAAAAARPQYGASLTAAPSWWAGGELHISILDVRLLDDVPLKQLWSLARLGTAQGPTFAVQLADDAAQWRGPFWGAATSPPGGTAAGRPAAGPLARSKASPAFPIHFALPLRGGKQPELKLLLLRPPGRRPQQQLLAASRISLANVLASGEGIVAVPVMTRKGAFPVSVKLRLSVSPPPEIAAR